MQPMKTAFHTQTSLITVNQRELFYFLFDPFHRQPYRFSKLLQFGFDRSGAHLDSYNALHKLTNPVYAYQSYRMQGCHKRRDIFPVLLCGSNPVWECSSDGLV